MSPISLLNPNNVTQSVWRVGRSIQEQTTSYVIVSIVLSGQNFLREILNFIEFWMATNSGTSDCILSWLLLDKCPSVSGVSRQAAESGCCLIAHSICVFRCIYCISTVYILLCQQQYPVKEGYSEKFVLENDDDDDAILHGGRCRRESRSVVWLEWVHHFG